MKTGKHFYLESGSEVSNFVEPVGCTGILRNDGGHEHHHKIDVMEERTNHRMAVMMTEANHKVLAISKASILLWQRQPFLNGCSLQIQRWCLIGPSEVLTAPVAWEGAGWPLWFDEEGFVGRHYWAPGNVLMGTLALRITSVVYFESAVLYTLQIVEPFSPLEEPLHFKMYILWCSLPSTLYQERICLLNFCLTFSCCHRNSGSKRQKPYLQQARGMRIIF